MVARELVLTSGRRVLDAAEPAVQAHAPDALLVARQAQPDLVGGTGTGLGHELGVGNLAAHDADEIAVALGQRPLGLQRVLEPADADHGQIDGLADGRGDEQRVAGWHMHRRFDHEQARGRHADRSVDVVDLTGRLDDAGDVDRLVDRRAVLDQLVTAQTHAEGEARPDLGPHRRDDLDEKAGAVLQAPAVVVGAPVRGRRQEPTHDRGVRALQFDAVEAALGAMAGHQRVAAHDLGDLAGVDRLWHLAEQRVGHRRRRPHRPARVHARRLPAVVVDLGEDRHAVAMDRIGDPSVAGDDTAVEAVDELLVRPIGGVGRVLLGDDQADAGRGARLVVGGMLLGRMAVSGVVREVRREHQTILDGDRPEPERGPEEARRRRVDGHRRRLRPGLPVPKPAVDLGRARARIRSAGLESLPDMPICRATLWTNGDLTPPGATKSVCSSTANRRRSCVTRVRSRWTPSTWARRRRARRPRPGPNVRCPSRPSSRTSLRRAAHGVSRRSVSTTRPGRRWVPRRATTCTRRTPRPARVRPLRRRRSTVAPAVRRSCLEVRPASRSVDSSPGPGRSRPRSRRSPTPRWRTTRLPAPSSLAPSGPSPRPASRRVLRRRASARRAARFPPGSIHRRRPIAMSCTTRTCAPSGRVGASPSRRPRLAGRSVGRSSRCSWWSPCSPASSSTSTGRSRLPPGPSSAGRRSGTRRSPTSSRSWRQSAG